MLSAVMEDYIKAIYALEESDERVATSALATELDVTPPTVSSMLQKLEARELVDHEKYKGVRLTDEGEIVALEILRHHRLLESFLTETLDYDWADVHDEADRLEHHVSAELTDRIATALDNPEADPHGDPIPNRELELPESVSTRRLDAATEGDRLVVRRIRNQNDEELRYLADAGVEPGERLEVIDIAPFGMVTVATDDGEQSLPRSIARRIEAVPASEATA